MRITTNGTTISGSLSEVLATLTHITQLTAGQAVTTNPVTTPEVTETAVTYEVAAKAVAKALVAKLGAEVTTESETTPAPVPKPARDSVIKMAIADVKDLLSRNHTDSTRRGEESNRIAAHIGHNLWFSSENGLFRVHHAVDFVVNADKRTVAAIINWVRRNEEISKGRAKCAPTDIFNEHIGKAIALRRALGLAVPVEYYEVEARDRDDLAVGDLVSDNEDGCDEIYEITNLVANPNMSMYPGQAFVRKGGFGWLASSQVTLINDSARHTAPDL